MTTTAVSATRRTLRELADGTIRVQVDVDPSFRTAFLEMFPNIDMPIALVPLRANFEAIQQQEKEKTANAIAGSLKPQEGGKAQASLASKLHIDGYFYNRKLWDAMETSGAYSQKEHKAYVESMKCLGTELAFLKQSCSCHGDLVLHHCRDAANSGTGIKPKDWFGVPLCHSHHNLVHGGQLSRLQQQQIMEVAVRISADQMKAKMKQLIGIESLSEINNTLLAEFEAIVGL